MFGLGMSTRDIQNHIDEIYGQSLSPETISTITDSVLERAKEWQNRPLQPVYPIIFLDALVIKLRQERVVKNAVLYGVIGISLDGRKECLGLYLSKDPESSRFWLSVMNELKNRGVQDVLSVDKGFLRDLDQGVNSRIKRDSTGPVIPSASGVYDVK
jgi:putative transposase